MPSRVGQRDVQGLSLPVRTRWPDASRSPRGGVEMFGPAPRLPSDARPAASDPCRPCPSPPPSRPEGAIGRGRAGSRLGVRPFASWKFASLRDISVARRSGDRYRPPSRYFSVIAGSPESILASIAASRIVLWSLPGTISTTASLPSFGERLLQEPDRTFEIERVELAGDDVELAGELGAERRPVPFQDEADVVRLPGPGHLGVDGAGRRGPRACAGGRRGPSGLKTASNEWSWPPSPMTSSIREKSVEEEDRAACPSRAIGPAVPLRGRGTCSRRGRRGRSAGSRGNRPGRGWWTRCRRRYRDR